LCSVLVCRGLALRSPTAIKIGNYMRLLVRLINHAALIGLSLGLAACGGGGSETSVGIEQDQLSTVTFDLVIAERVGGGELVQEVRHGRPAKAPEFMLPEGVTFSGWSESLSYVTSDRTIRAQYKTAAPTNLQAEFGAN